MAWHDGVGVVSASSDACERCKAHLPPYTNSGVLPTVSIAFEAVAEDGDDDDDERTVAVGRALAWCGFDTCAPVGDDDDDDDDDETADTVSAVLTADL